MKKSSKTTKYLAWALLMGIAPLTGFAAEEKAAQAPADQKVVVEPKASTDQKADADTAAAEAAKDAAKFEVKYDELTMSELQNVVFNFKAVGIAGGTEPNDKVVLSGTMFEACEKLFTISTVKLGSVMGVEVTDNGGEGRSCVAKMRKKFKSCARATEVNAKNRCIRLSEREDAKIDLTNAGDVNLKLIHRDPALDITEIPSEEFEPKISRKSPEHYARIEADRIEEDRRRLRDQFDARRKAELDMYSKQLANCNKSEEELAIKRQALEALLIAGKLTATEGERKEKEIVNDETKLLAKRVDSVDVADEEALSELETDLKAFASDHPEKSKDIFALIKKLADRSVSGKKKTPEDYDRALSIITDARDFPGLTSAQSRDLDTAESAAMVHKLNLVAQQGAYSPVFMPTYQSTMSFLQTSMQNSCYTADGDQQACMNSMTAYQNAMQAPQQAWQVTQQQMQLRQQMQQQMMQMQQQMMGGMNMLQNPNMNMNMNMMGNMNGMNMNPMTMNMMGTGVMPSMQMSSPMMMGGGMNMGMNMGGSSMMGAPMVGGSMGGFYAGRF